MSLTQIINSIENLIKQGDQSNEKISKRGTYWHIDHVLRVINGVVSTLADSDPKADKGGFNLARLYVFTTGSIPRGAGKAPKAVTNENAIEESELVILLNKAKESINKLDQIAANNYFQHKRFGALKKRKTIKFIKIHTNHHLKIIKDILN